MSNSLLHRNVRIVPQYPITHRFRVADEFEGQSLLQMMIKRFPFRAPAEWQQRILDGRVGIENRAFTPDTLLKLTDQIYHHNPAVTEPSVPDEVKVLQEDENYILVYKPAPMPMHPGGRYNKNTLTEILKDQGYSDLKIVHRLDAVTTGLVLFARNKDWSRNAMECFRQGKVEKSYYALVSGVPDTDSMVIDSPIRRKTGFVFETAPGLQRAKEACTQFEVVLRGEQMAVVRCRPETGRTHQIRLHLERWGYPIWDDPIYGPGGDKSSRKAQNIAIGLFNAGLRIDALNIRKELDIPGNWIRWTKDPESLPV